MCSLCGWEGIRTRWTRKCPQCGNYAPHAIGPASGPLWPVSDQQGLTKEIADTAVRLAQMIEVAQFTERRDIRNAVVVSLAGRLNRQQIEELLGLPLMINSLKTKQEREFMQHPTLDSRGTETCQAIVPSERRSLG